MPLIMFVSSSFNTYVNLPKKRYKSDGFTIFYNGIPIFNPIMNCLLIILSWSPQQNVTCLLWYHVAQNLINIFPNRKWNHNLFSHFHFTTIIQPLQSLYGLACLTVHKFSLLTRMALQTLTQLPLSIIKPHTLLYTKQCV